MTSGRNAHSNSQSTKLLSAAPILALLACLQGCVVAPFQSVNDHTHQLWDEYEAPPSSLAAPEGFKVTPEQAYKIVTLDAPQKSAWYIYADQTNYYLVEHAPLLIPTSGYARKYGAKVDGRSGLCLRRCPGQLAAP